MGSAWRLRGNFGKVCLPSGVSEALITAAWRRGCESEGDGGRRGGGRLDHQRPLPPPSQKSDVISRQREAKAAPPAWKAPLEPLEFGGDDRRRRA